MKDAAFQACPAPGNSHACSHAGFLTIFDSQVARQEGSPRSLQLKDDKLELMPHPLPCMACIQCWNASHGRVCMSLLSAVFAIICAVFAPLGTRFLCLLCITHT